MKNGIRHLTVFMIATAMVFCMLAGCGTREEDLDPMVAADGYEDEDFEEEYYEEEMEPEEEYDEMEPEESVDPVGKWYTQDYDETDNWASSYVIELKKDGTATCTGWRNKDEGTYTVEGASVFIVFDHCEVDSPEEGGFTPVEDFVYTVEMECSGDDATIVIDAPDTISNLENGKMHREAGAAPAAGDAEEGDAGEGVDIADGTYITDETYKGDLSAEGETLAIETALSHYDHDWNLVPDYEKRTYVFTTSKDCKCVIFTEDKEEAPIAEKVEFINEFLEGNSGLPITLVIKNNELVEIQFSS